MPFGLANAPATYQRLMEEVMGELHCKICYVCIDDVIIFTKTYEEHLQNLNQVFQKISEAGLKLAPNKCSLFKKKANEKQLDVKCAQRQHPVLSIWIPLVEAGKRPLRQELPNSQEHSVLLKNFDKLRMKDGLLYREVTKDGDTIFQQIVPRSRVPIVLYLQWYMMTWVIKGETGLNPGQVLLGWND
ncbi:uncharacterized protein LOC117332248 [Pecten maximus]|uniref:uncharacterized protein LOC117332248 n=1 Tax=Pecten maximus TaxID=6579 RepID=UPI0014581B5D|nr:uncharacterized protein LOC117332248 [Pecten maximus]